jgi:RNA polymerase sigma factor (sigma-70 family)
MRVMRTSTPEALEQLIDEARARDSPAATCQAAFGVLVERYQDAAYRYAVALLGDPHLARDAAQEAFLTAYGSLNQLRAADAFPSWLRRIVRTHCRRLQRAQQPAVASLDAACGLALGAQVDPALVAEGRERRRAIAAAVRTLPAGQQVVTRLFYVSGYPQRQIAEHLSLPLTTVKKRLQAARRRLQAQLVVLMDDDAIRRRTRRSARSFAERILHTVRMLTAFAATDGEASLLELLLVDGLDADTPDSDGRTLLSWAAQRGQLDAIRWLLRRSASLNARDHAGLTPLGWAERSHQHEAAAILHRAGGVR